MKKNSCKISFFTTGILSLAFLTSFRPEPLFGDLIYVGNYNPYSVTTLDTATNTFVGPLIPVDPRPYGILVTPDGDFVYVANDTSDLVTVINTETNSVVTTVPVGIRPDDIAITPNGLEVWSPNQGSGTISVIDTATNTVILPPIVVTGQVTVVIFDPTGSFAYAGFIGTPTVLKINTATKMIVGSGAAHSTLSMAITPDGARLYVAGSASNSVLVLDAVTLASITTIPVGMLPYSIAITPDGTRAYVANLTSNNVSVLDIVNNVPLTTIPGITGAIGVTITEDGAFAYVTSGILSGNIYAIETATNTISAIIPPFTPGILPFRLAAGPALPVVTNLTGKQQKEDSGLEYQLFNTLSWEAGSPSIIGFYVYRNGIKIATLDASTFQYTDNNSKKSLTTVYAVTPIDMDGSEGSPTTIAIKGL